MFVAEIILSIIIVIAFVILFSVSKRKEIKNDVLYNVAIICTAVIVLCQILFLIVYKLNGNVYEYMRQIIGIIPWFIILIMGIIFKYSHKKR